MRRSVFAAAGVAALFLCSLGAYQSGGEPATKAAVVKAMEEEQWARAKRLLAQMMAAAAEAERLTLAPLAARVDAEIDFADLKADIERSNSAWRTKAAKLDQDMKEWSAVPEVIAKATALRDQLRRDACLSLEDFEDPDRYLSASGMYERVHEVTDPKLVKSGAKSVRFSGRVEIVVKLEVHDWSPYEAIALWAYAESPNGILTITPQSDRKSRYIYTTKIDWSGWKEIVVPLKGKTFTQKGTPDWTNIASVMVGADKAEDIKVILDDVHLEKR